MPSGLTAIIGDSENCSLSDFAFKCATQFVVYCRDNDYDLRTKIFELASLHYGIELAKSKKRLEEFEALSMEEIKKIQEEEASDTVKRNELRKKNNQVLTKKYNDMLQKAMAWEAPESCKSLKEFMIEQIKSSIQYDCYDESTESVETSSAIVSTEEYRKKRIEYMKDDIEYFGKKAEREMKYIDSVNSFLNDLRTSLVGQ